jgi:hypothetical protein
MLKTNLSKIKRTDSQVNNYFKNTLTCEIEGIRQTGYQVKDYQDRSSVMNDSSGRDNFAAEPSDYFMMPKKKKFVGQINEIFDDQMHKQDQLSLEGGFLGKIDTKFLHEKKTKVCKNQPNKTAVAWFSVEKYKMNQKKHKRHNTLEIPALPKINSGEATVKPSGSLVVSGTEEYLAVKPSKVPVEKETPLQADIASIRARLAVMYAPELEKEGPNINMKNYAPIIDQDEVDRLKQDKRNIDNLLENDPTTAYLVDRLKEDG